MLFEKNYTNKTVRIGGMSCEHCKARVEKGLGELKEVKSVEVNLENKTALIVLKKELSEDVIKNTIEDLGFSYEGVEE